MVPGELSIAVQRHRAPCVLDPHLVLGHAMGPELALGLARVFEAWLTRSFWQVLDSSELLVRQAARGAPDTVDARAMLAWLALRDTTDAGSWTLRWAGDSVAESHVGDAADGGVIERYEQVLAAWTDGGMPVGADGFDARAGALDALALSAALGGVRLLCCTRADAQGGPGVPCVVEVLALLPGRVRVEAVDPLPADSLFAVEARQLREALVMAGLVTVVERLCGRSLRLAVVHLALLDGDDGDDDGGVPRAAAWWYVV